MATSIGIGLTNNCNLNCPHCYSRPMKKNNLALPQIEEIIKKYPQVRDINLGTGESILNPSFGAIVKYILTKGIHVGLTSNGKTVNEMDISILKMLKDVDISLDYANEKDHDAWRGAPGTFERALKALERCKEAGINTSIAMALMSVNYKELPKFREILNKFDCCLRINIYKPVGIENFSLSYEQFWDSIRMMADNFDLKSCSEPVLALIVPDMTTRGSPCGTSIRIHPDGIETPCVYMDGEKIDKKQFNRMKKRVPKPCNSCGVKGKCMGGCLGRRILENRIDKPDRYCPIPLKLEVPKITFTYSQERGEFIHASYLCTIILR